MSAVELIITGMVLGFVGALFGIGIVLVLMDLGSE